MTIISLHTRWLFAGLALAAALFFSAAPSVASADGGIGSPVTNPGPGNPQPTGGIGTNANCNGNGGGCG